MQRKPKVVRTLDGNCFAHTSSFRLLLMSSASMSVSRMFNANAVPLFSNYSHTLVRIWIVHSGRLFTFDEQCKAVYTLFDLLGLKFRAAGSVSISCLQFHYRTLAVRWFSFGLVKFASFSAYPFAVYASLLKNK